MNIAYVNGQFLNANTATISLFDRGFLFGDSIYEVLPVYNKKACFVENHICRLNDNLRKIKISPPELDWESVFTEIIKHSAHTHFQIYIQVTRGNQGLRKHDIPSNIEPSIIVFAIHNKFPTHEEKLAGLTAKLLEDYRWERCDIKSTSLLANILLNDDAVSSGYQTSILMRNGILTEGSTSNVFVVSENDCIKTTPLNNLCLPGITRAITIEIIKKLGLRFLEEEIEVSHLLNAKEVWITSTTKEIFPVRSINDTLINNGVVGPKWIIINQEYQKLIA